MNETRQPSAEHVQEARRFAVFISLQPSRRIPCGLAAIESLRAIACLGAWLARTGPSAPSPLGLDDAFGIVTTYSASGDLSDAIRDALVNSDSMARVVLPNCGAASPYVNEEVRTFKALAKGHRILAAISSGEPHAASRAGFFAADECFPPALLRQIGPDGAPTELPEGREPLAADFREGKDEREAGKLKLLAGLLGVGLDDLVQT